MKFKKEFKNLITTQGNRKSLLKFKGTVSELRKYLEVKAGIESALKTNKEALNAMSMSFGLPNINELI